MDKHKMVDDRPFGGGDGMVMKPEPIFAAIENLLGTSDRDAYPKGTRVVLLSPQGRQFKQAVAREFADEVQTASSSSADATRASMNGSTRRSSPMRSRSAIMCFRAASRRRRRC